MRMIDSRLNRFEESESGCWIWQGKLKQSGYGTLTVCGRTVRAHRLMYETMVGPIPEGLVIDHLCRVRACVNPAHLEPVTNAENHHRRPPKDVCINGHAMTPENVYVSPRGARNCRTCQRLARKRTYYSRFADKCPTCGK